MYTFHEPYIGINVSGNAMDNNNSVVEKFAEFVREYDIENIYDLCDFVEEQEFSTIEELLENEDTYYAEFDKDFFRWLIDNKDCLVMSSHYHGSSDEVPISISYVTNDEDNTIDSDDVFNYTWTLKDMSKYMEFVKDFDSFCRGSMSSDLYASVRGVIGLSFINLSS